MRLTIRDEAQGRFHKRLAVRPGNERARIAEEFDAIELSCAENVLERFPPGSPGHIITELRRFFIAGRIRPAAQQAARRDAQGMSQQQAGLRPGGLRQPCARGSQWSDGSQGGSVAGEAPYPKGSRLWSPTFRGIKLDQERAECPVRIKRRA